MKKVKKMRGGNQCDKANTNTFSKSNEITEEKFIEYMNDKTKRNRFIELVSSGGYNRGCLINFKDKIDAELERLNKEIEDGEKIGMLKFFQEGRIPKITMLVELKSYITDSLREPQKPAVSGKQSEEFSFDSLNSQGSDEVSGSNDASIRGHRSSSNVSRSLGLVAPNSGKDALKSKRRGGKSRKHKTKR